MQAAHHTSGFRCADCLVVTIQFIKFLPFGKNAQNYHFILLHNESHACASLKANNTQAVACLVTDRATFWKYVQRTYEAANAVNVGRR